LLFVVVCYVCCCCLLLFVVVCCYFLLFEAINQFPSTILITLIALHESAVKYAVVVVN
jgi:hypothetical protein